MVRLALRCSRRVMLMKVCCEAQGGLNIPGISRESAERHRMAASHSPQMGNGLLAESLETSVPMFGESHSCVRAGLLSLISLSVHHSDTAAP